MFINIIIISLYLPCANTELELITLSSILDEIKSDLVAFPNHKIVCAGDFNVSLNGSSAVLVKQSMSHFDLRISVGSFSNGHSVIDYTYAHETLGHYSKIDYILISNSICDRMLDLSEHNPVKVELRWSLEQNVNAKTNTSTARPDVLRWDHSDVRNYYNATHEYFKSF